MPSGVLEISLAPLKEHEAGIVECSLAVRFEESSLCLYVQLIESNLDVALMRQEGG